MKRNLGLLKILDCGRHSSSHVELKMTVKEPFSRIVRDEFYGEGVVSRWENQCVSNSSLDCLSVDLHNLEQMSMKMLNSCSN